VLAATAIIGVAPPVWAKPPVPSNTAATAQATAVAADLGQAMWSFDWRIDATEAAAELRRWVTPQLWTTWRGSPGAPAGQAARVAEHEIDRVRAVSAVVADVAPAAVGVAVSATVTVTRDGHRVASGRDDAEMLVVRIAAGWRVAEVDL
jgi:hypothetical protein